MGRVFSLLFYNFILKPKPASLGVRLQQLHPTLGWLDVSLAPGSEESLGQGEMTPKPLHMMKHPDSF